MILQNLTLIEAQNGLDFLGMKNTWLAKYGHSAIGK